MGNESPPADKTKNTDNSSTAMENQSPAMADKADKTPWKQPDCAIYWVSVVLVFVIVGILLLLLLWLSALHKKLRYSVVDASITGYNSTNGDHLNTSLRFVIRARNPNPHIWLYYDAINATILQNHKNLSTCNIPPFHQPPRNDTDLEVRLAAGDLAVEKASGYVEVEVKLVENFRWKDGPFKVSRTANVNCRAVRVPIMETSKNKFGKVPCRVHTDA